MGDVDFCIERMSFNFVMYHSSHRSYQCTRGLILIGLKGRADFLRLQDESNSFLLLKAAISGLKIIQCASFVQS